MNKFLRNRERKPDPDSKIPLWNYYYFSLSFTYHFKYDNDTVYFAHAVPYTYYDDLMPFLNKLSWNVPLYQNREIDINKKKTKESREITDYSSYLRIGTL